MAALPNHHVADSMKDFMTNNYFRSLLAVIPRHILQPIFRKYQVGTSKTGEPVFWQLDPNLNLVNGICENSRIFAGNEGLFGHHLLYQQDAVEIIVGIVNRPQTAIVMDAYLNRMGRNNKKVVWVGARTIDAALRIGSGWNCVVMPDNKKWDELAMRTVDKLVEKRNAATLFRYKAQGSADSPDDALLQAGPPDVRYERPTSSNKLQKTTYNQLSDLFERCKTDERIRQLCAALDAYTEQITRNNISDDKLPAQSPKGI